MAYVVLARKYRPSTFDALVGQEPIVRTLTNAVAMGRVHHAFLLTGARGVGKTSTARLMARAFNCAEGPTMTPCGRCPSCQELAKGASASVVEIDGASNTGVDNVRELREGARYVPAQGRFKIYIVDEVHMLSQAAFNALLKVLEEPPAHVKFIFATTEPHKIPATILSRCQRFDFRRLALGRLVAHLEWVLARENTRLDADVLQIIARQAQGSVRDALSLLDQVLSYAGEQPEAKQAYEALGVVDHRLVFALVDAILARDAAALLQQVAEAENSGHDLGQLAQLLLEHLRDVAVAGLANIDVAEALGHRSPDERAQLVRQAACRSAGDWQRLFDKACDVVAAMRFAAANKIVLEMGLLRLMHLAPAADLGTLLLRLDGLVAGTPLAEGAPAAGALPAPSCPPARALEPATVTPHPQATSAFVTSPTLTRAPELVPPEGRAAPPAVARPASASVPPSPAAPAPQAPAAAPGTAPPAATASAPAPTAEDLAPNAEYRAFVQQVRGRKPSLASVLEHGQLVRFVAGEEVVTAFAPDTFWWDAVTDGDNRALFEAVLQGQLAAKTAWKVVPLQQGQAHKTPTLAQQRERDMVAGWEKTRSEAQNHAAVRAAGHILGASLQDIRPVSEVIS